MEVGCFMSSPITLKELDCTTLGFTLVYVDDVRRGALPRYLVCGIRLVVGRRSLGNGVWGAWLR
jgi:hypothetical protein